MNELRAAHSLGTGLFGSKPLAVIWRAKGGYRPIRGIVTSEQADELERTRLQNSADLQKLGANGLGVVTENSGHDVHLD